MKRFLFAILLIPFANAEVIIDIGSGFDCVNGVCTGDLVENKVQINISGDAFAQSTLSGHIPPATAPPPSGSPLAFPGAEGFGKDSLGGRGGTVIKVTNLNDSGAGSFRAAVETADPRIIVFDVSGIIDLQSELRISNPFVSIFGQTSPGGILVTGYSTIVQTSHFTMQHMRFRVGSHGGGDPDTKDALSIWGKIGGGAALHDIIVDHCSLGWAIDENFSSAYDLTDVTFSYNIVHEGLTNAGHSKGNHSKGLFIWAKFSPNLNISLHHNFMTQNKDRNPLINTGVTGGTLLVDVANNVTYNSFGGYHMGSSTGDVNLNWRHNFVKLGNQSNSSSYEIYHETNDTIAQRLYVVGNIGASRATQTGSDWTVARDFTFNLVTTDWERLTMWPVDAVTVTTMTSSYSETVAFQAGATKPTRDSVDQKLVDDYVAGTGDYRSNVSFPADFPVYPTPAAPTDTDDDGMPNSWETANGLNPAVDDSALDRNGDGYTNIEEYVASL